MTKKIRIVELFSGIGSQAEALKNLGYDVEVLGTCEWDMQAFTAYSAIHNRKVIIPRIKEMNKEEILQQLRKYTLSCDGKKPISKKTLNSYSLENLQKIYSSLLLTKNMVDVSSVKGKDMPNKIDLLTYSFPCQDLSNVGALHGYTKGIDKNSGSRSSLLWEVGRILSEMKKNKKHLPKYLVMENVPTLLSNRHRQNFETWIKDLNKLGYESKYFPLNANSFGIPQHRPRLLMLSIYCGKNRTLRNKVIKYFANIDSEKIVLDYQKSKYYEEIAVKDLLRTDYRRNDLYSEAINSTPNNTPSRRDIWNNNPKIIDENGYISNNKFIRTLTTKQDRHPNSGNVYFESGIKGKSKYRFLTPRECLLFMGFKDEDYDNILRFNSEHRGTTLFPRDKIVRMAGNSIPVQLLEGLFYQIEKIEKIV